MGLPRNYRYSKWDYHGRGIYMITMNIDGRKPLLGRLLGDVQGAWVDYSPLGRAVSEQIEACLALYPDIQICAKQLMPDHLHLVVWVKERLPVALGEIIRRLKIGCTHAYWEDTFWEDTLRMNAQSTNATNTIPSGTADSLPSGAADGLPSGAADSIDGTDAPKRRGPSLFEPGFHDRIMMHAGQLRSMIDYVHDNPRRLAMKRARPDLFTIRQDVRAAGFTLAALGNLFLLDYPMKEVLQCSRRLTQQQIDQQRDLCLCNAERGMVYVTAAISEGEKQISRAIREAGFPLVVLLEKGFPKADSPHYKFFKPQGVYFEACAMGRLLLIEPNENLYDNQEIERAVYAKAGLLPHTTQRYRFLALNELAKHLTTPPATPPITPPK